MGQSTANAAFNAYDYNFTNLLTGKELHLQQFAGKVLLVVNTASNCGFTNQYTALENLYQEFKDQGLVVIGVPSNDFGHQEPGSNEEVANFCRLNFGVTFPMTRKEIVSGPNAHPFYKWAKEQTGSAPKWNFHKYLINRNGQIVTYFYSTTSPDAKRLKTKIVELLG